MKTVFTIGYEGASITDFIETLRIAGVQVIIDVRALPLSRKPGFSKRALADKLEDAKIEYVHMSASGDPKPGRDAARSGDFSKFRQIFGAHLKLSETRLALANVTRLALSSTVCLLCFERMHAHCHRSMVADAMNQFNSFNITHIGVRKGISSSDSMYHDISFENFVFR